MFYIKPNIVKNCKAIILLREEFIFLVSKSGHLRPTPLDRKQGQLTTEVKQCRCFCIKKAK